MIHLERWHTTITRVRPGSKTERGSTVPDWDEADRKEISGCLFQPVSTMLSLDGRVAGITDGAMVCAPVDADIQTGDRIEYDGTVYTINGDPMRWTGVGRLENMQLNLQRWHG